jgi:phage-related protein
MQNSVDSHRGTARKAHRISSQLFATSVQIPSIGPDVKEIRIREKDGAFRVFYAASFAKAVYLLHCFQKKTQKTSDADKELAKRRYKDLVKELGK